MAITACRLSGIDSASISAGVTSLERRTHISDIHRRKDVNPSEGQHEYGNVEYADSVNKKYPVDTPEHVRAAWSYIHHKDDRAEYSSEDVRKIESRIKSAAKKHGVEISEKN